MPCTSRFRPAAFPANDGKRPTDEMKKRTEILTALALLAVPSVAQANAGTPLAWVGMLHLVFGNLLIGVLEGILLAQLFTLSKKKCIGLLILANYLSSWIGGLLLSRAISSTFPLNLNNAWMLFWLMVLLTYIITVVLEFPFVAFHSRLKHHLWRGRFETRHICPGTRCCSSLGMLRFACMIPRRTRLHCSPMAGGRLL